ncbi:MAG: 50S ribosomal protein L11 methyltransferase [Rickettsiales bacterium]
MKNPFAQPKLPLQLTIEAPKETLDIVELVLEDEVLSITRPIDTHTPQLILLIEDAQQKAIETRIHDIAKQQAQLAKIHGAMLRDIDWVSKVQKDFPPFMVGRCYIYGSHAEQPIPANSIPLKIDAAAAFGTGEHDTTAGCLLALQWLKKKQKHVRHALDMGCGTAILAIAAAKLWRSASVSAYDNDAGAVRTSRENFACNHLRRMHAYVSDGYKTQRVKREGKHDVVVANILARPLMRMAYAASQSVAPNGTLILSGLLNHQENMVLSAHRYHGLRLKKRIRRGRWSVLILEKKSPSPSNL